ncbi:uncharacterized protein LOC127802589 [Diospyros lotus]|uniref:uncharacterized protein LOC127802589 n=1 Tax=Diospyros lotus TaxID=55363 RepID=UPI002254B6B2|nr:uncharacterized protein LOC127802589 [Diospyros lotus]
MQKSIQCHPIFSFFSPSSLTLFLFLAFSLPPCTYDESRDIEMHEPPYHRTPERGSRNLASCMVATVFLLFLITAGTTVFFFLFKPKNPRIAVEAVQLPTFSSSNGTANFTFFQYVSVTNPNRDAFTHYDSSLRLLHSGRQVGLVFIPAGQIDGGRTQRMSAKFDVERYPLPLGSGGGGGDQKMMMMEIETRMEVSGRVRVLRLLTHRVESRARCRVAVEVRGGGGSVLALHC